MTKASNLREMKIGKLNERLNDAREELMNLRFQQSSGELTDYNRLRITRREIARILTIIDEVSKAGEVEGEE
jgi:large subunit ribosomal protein L29